MARNISIIKKLSPAKIDNSPEIQQWVYQFSENDQSIAKLLLSQLKFISYSDYSEWLKKTVLSIIDSSTVYALYSIRKLDEDNKIYWDENGVPVSRSGHSLGSEDLVYSSISNLVRMQKNFLDHPPLDELKNKRIRNYILIDDSIGSGDRVSNFINSMLHHPTFLSWWSFGWVQFHIVSFARTKESEKKILLNLKGSNSSKRKILKSSKIKFTSRIVYQKHWFRYRWGDNYEQLIELCKRKKQIKSWARLGYDNVFSNIIFYHSVPNNTPGMIWFDNKTWTPLMPKRVVPQWLIDLLEENDCKAIRTSQFSNEMQCILKLIKKGIRKMTSIAIRLELDVQYTRSLLQHMISLGLITESIRLTPRGREVFHQILKQNDTNSWNYSLYLPRSWCADSKSI